MRKLITLNGSLLVGGNQSVKQWNALTVLNGQVAFISGERDSYVHPDDQEDGADRTIVRKLAETARAGAKAHLDESTTLDADVPY